MPKFYDKLEVKLTASFIILILIISALMFTYTYRSTKSALKRSMQDELLAVAQVVASQINGDELAKIKKGGEKKADFIRIRDMLYTAEKANPDIRYIYTYRANDDKSVRFIVDGEYGHSGDAAGIDEVYSDITPRMMEAFSKATIEDEYSMDKWGSLISGYAPVRDSAGRIVGVLGVNMTSEKTVEKQKFLGKTLFIIFMTALLIAGIIIEVFSKTIIRDVNKLNAVANEISTGNMNVKMDVKRKDEIGELADSFGRMVASLKIMMMEDRSDKK